jgi:hypothetical protein
MRRAVSLLAGVLLLASACGGGESAPEALSKTSANLGKIRSGDLSVELLFSAKGGERAGFSLEGPFAFRQGGLPEAELDYTQIAGGRTATQTFIMTGGKAYVRIHGTTFELPEATAARIRGAVGVAGGLGVIDLSRWVEDPKLSDGGEVGGADTDRINAKLNVPATVSGLVALASQFGGTTPLPALSGASAEQIERAVDKATVDVWTGKDDRLLRKLEISLAFSPSAASEDVQGLVEAAMHFTLGISNPNEKVTVETPTGVQPYPGS